MKYLVSSIISYILLLVACTIVAVDDLESIEIIGNYDGATQLIMNDLALAYRVVDPTIKMTLSLANSPDTSVNNVVSLSSDFGITSAPLTNNQAMIYPNLDMYPAMIEALVPIYRLDALGPNASPIVLSREALAQIYLGDIVWWNDTRLNQPSGMILPSQMITMVLPSTIPLANQLVLSTALSKFYPNFSSIVQPALIPSWPTQKYANTIRAAFGLTGQCASVISNDGSFAYTFQSIATQLKTSYASLINKAGNIVQANSNSITFAAVELGTKDRSKSTDAMDLTDATGSSAWPLTMVSFFLLDTIQSRSTCRLRQSTLEFLLWFYTSDTVNSLLSSRQHSMVPDIVLSQLDVINQLKSDIYCRGNLALPVAITNTRTIGTPTSVSFVTSLLTNVYSGNTDVNTKWNTQTNNDNVILRQVVNGELDIGLVNPYNLDTDYWDLVTKDSDFLLLPLFLTGVSLSFNPAITKSLNIAGYSLSLDVATIGLIFYGCIWRWNDPIILLQNPWLLPLLPTGQDIPMTLICGCGTSSNFAPITYSFLKILSTYKFEDSINSRSLQQCITHVTNANIRAQSFTGCVSIPISNPNTTGGAALFLNDETSIPGIVLGTIGSIGIMQTNGDPSFGKLILTTSKQNTTASVSSLSRCVNDQSIGTSGIASIVSSDNPSCWTGTQEIIAVARSSYVSKAIDSSSCIRGIDTLNFLHWFSSNDNLNAVTDSTNMVRIPGVKENIKSSYLRVLDNIACDGENMLITLPILWHLATGIQTFAIVFAVIGIISCVASIVFVMIWKSHHVIRSASYVFMILSLLGLMMMFVSGILLVQPASTENCQTFSWFLFLGLTFSFGPLFTKTWRIYRIFGTRKLKVVSISNRKLLLLTGILFTFKIILLIVWQSQGNLQPMINDVVSSSTSVLTGRPIVNRYVQCGLGGGNAEAMFFVVIIVKCVMFAIGALLAFSTRKVSSTFNESSGIAFTIYNVCFTVGIIGPIIVVISATGDVLILLLSFALLWISFFTTGILILPKMFKVLGKNEADTEGSTSNATNSSSGYAFVSISNIGTVNQLKIYYVALQKQLDIVSRKIKSMGEILPMTQMKQININALNSPTPTSSNTRLKRYPKQVRIRNAQSNSADSNNSNTLNSIPDDKQK